MSKARAEQLIVVSLFVLLASTVGAHLAGGRDKQAQKHYGRKITGGFFTMLFASIFAEFAAEPAALLAVAVASYAFFNEGLPAINKRFPKTEQQKREALENSIREKGGTIFPPFPGAQESSPTNLGRSQLV